MLKKNIKFPFKKLKIRFNIWKRKLKIVKIQSNAYGNNIMQSLMMVRKDLKLCLIFKNNRPNQKSFNCKIKYDYSAKDNMPNFR